MLFKNITLYQLTDPFAFSAEKLEEQLQNLRFMPCPRTENMSVGWISPYGRDHDLLVHSMKGYFLIAFCKEEKILPASVIKEELQKKIAAIEQQEDRVIYRKEKNSLRDEIIISLRAQAFSRKRVTYAYIDLANQWLLVDTASKNKAEELCSFLRKTLGSLKLALPITKQSPEKIMTHWLVEQRDLADFKIQNNCEMLDAKQKQSMIKCKEQDLNAKEILNHLHSGKEIVKLSLNWQDKICFDLNDELSIKKIKFTDLLQGQRQDVKTQSDQEQLDADFALMTGEFSAFLQALWGLFDGLQMNNDS